MSESPTRRGPLFYRNTHLLALSLVILMVAGLSALGSLPRLEDPRLRNRNPLILTTFPGASAERVEALVSEPIEEGLDEIDEIKRIETTSRVGVSVVALEFQDSVIDVDRVVAKVRDKLGEVELPEGTSEPTVDDQRGAAAFTRIVGLTWRSEGTPPLGLLGRLAEELADRLRAIPGTELVRVYGETEEEITVTIDPEEMAAMGLTGDQVSSRIAQADAKSPAGLYRGERSDLTLEVAGELDSLSRVAAIPIRDAEMGPIVRLGDIAEIQKRWTDPPREVALIQGDRGIMVAARVGDGYRADVWTVEADRVVEEFASTYATYEGGIQVREVFDQNRYTMARLTGLLSNLVTGAIVVMLVVLLTMGWRSSLLVGLALPLTMSSVLFGLALLGFPIHQMSIFGMIIALGLLIDNAIVVVDEVRSRLKQGQSPPEAVSQTIDHLKVPLGSSTLTTILAFMPIVLLNGNVGEFIGTISVSVILAVSASLFISLTMIAALAGRFGGPSADSRGPTWLRTGLTIPPLARGFERLVDAAVRHPIAAIIVVASVPATGFGLASTLDDQFFPGADRDQFHIRMWLSSHASIDRTVEVAQSVERVVRDHEEVEEVYWLVGGSIPSVYYNMLMNQDDQPAYAQAVIRADSAEAVRRLIPELQRELDFAFPGARAVVLQLGQGPPIEAPVELRIYGSSLDRLRELGDRVRRVMATLPEFTHSLASIQGGEPKLWVDADEDQVRLAGLTLDDVARQLRDDLEGRTGGSILEQVEDLPVRVRFGDARRADMDRIASTNLSAPATDDWIPLTALGELDLRPQLGGITRDDGVRCNYLRAYLVAGTLPPEATQHLMEALEADGFELPPGYRMAIGGDAEESSEAIANLATYVPVLAVLMVATVVLSFRSFLLAGLLGGVAFMSIGLGMLALWFSGFPLGFNPIIGTAGLIGVAINDSIVVLAALRANPRAAAGDVSAIVEETLGCTRHVLSTTFTTVGGFLPLILSGGAFWPPLAVVIAGGVLGATFVALIFIPAGYKLLARWVEPSADDDADEPESDLSLEDDSAGLGFDQRSDSDQDPFELHVTRYATH